MSVNNINGNPSGEPGIEKYHRSERTEEVRDIIERMPTRFGLWISGIIIFIFLLLVLFGYIIRYPDVVIGKVTINTSVAPLKLVANTSGKLHINNIQSQSVVNSGEIIAYIENAASYDTLQYIRQVLKAYDPNNTHDTKILYKLPSTPPLGELTSKYYNFLSALHQLATFNGDKLYDKQIASLENLRLHLVREVDNSKTRTNINEGIMSYSQKSIDRDSILFNQKVSSLAEYDRTRLQHLSYNASYANAKTSQIDAEKQAEQTKNEIVQTRLKKSEKHNEIKIALLAAYNDLMDNIALWEQQYLFKSPFKGQAQFLRFWTNGQFVQSGEPVFTIVPEADKPYAQILLPAVGAGKVKPGQEVVIKLDDFPYNEYGSVKGRVNNISLTTNTEKSENGSLETYLITVSLPQGLSTNYGKSIAFRHEAKGTAEIITKDRRLIQRLFDNLKYVLNK